VRDERGGVPGPGSANSESAWYRKQVEHLVRRLSEAEGSLQSLSDGEVDAIVDPNTATPILLSRAQDQLLRSEARFRDLIARSPSIVCELSPDGTTVFANDAVRTVLGLRPAELVGKDWWSELVAPEQRRAANTLLAALQSGDITARELPLRAADGSLRWIEWTSANRYAPTGELQSVILFGLDVTARKVADEAERQLAEERVARAEAEAANKAKTEFLAVMSHELRTPLNAIAGYTDLLDAGVRGPVTPAQREDLERIRRAERHLLGLINDIMNFARLEAGQVTFDIGPVVVREVLENLEVLTHTQVAAKGVAYGIETCGPEIIVSADRDKMQQILLNLASNAVKFTETGGRITVGCEATGDVVRVTVADTGRGIPADKLSAIFDPFVQVNKQFTRDQEGVGLGLSISRDLARGMHGDLAVESAVGKGSRFTLTLPRA
jgi:PAS domain S-box-containing protein